MSHDWIEVSFSTIIIFKCNKKKIKMQFRCIACILDLKTQGIVQFEQIGEL